MLIILVGLDSVRISMDLTEFSSVFMIQKRSLRSAIISVNFEASRYSSLS